MSMSVINLFDPWKNKLCTCPLKYSLSPYTGCSHRCLYCYITSYIRDAFNPRVKKNYIEKFLRDLRRINRSFYISISNSSDPYQDLEKIFKFTRKTLKVISMQRLRALIITKSDLVLRDIDILRNGFFSVSITITTLDEDVAKVLEPGAPSPYRRIKVVETLINNNISVSVRIDPIIPGVNDDFKMLSKLVDKLAEIGVKHIVSSTYKLKPDSFRRIIRAFPSLERKLYKLYYIEGEKIHGYRYLNRRLRYNILSRMKNIVVSKNISFAVCREGFFDLNSGKTCDGSHLISTCK